MDSKFNENVFEKFYLRVSYFKSLSELVYLLTAGQGRKAVLKYTKYKLIKLKSVCAKNFVCCSVTSKKLPNVYKNCPKMISLEK